jgi:glycosyltransferase involved in cell wall biosynthesis
MSAVTNPYVRRVVDKKSNQKQILCLFDYQASTGFATVSKNIVSQLRETFGDNIYLTIIAINYFGDMYEEDNMMVVSAKKSSTYIDPKTGDTDDFGRHGFALLLQEGDYDGIFICQDLGVVLPWVPVLKGIKDKRRELNKKSFKSIFYFPVDGRYPSIILKNIEFFDLIVTYTEFGRKEIVRLKPELKSRIRVIPHGNNSKDFYPLTLEEDLAFRKEYFGENWNKFIINATNRNQPRKDIPATIFGFIEAKEQWPDDLPRPFLYLHMNPDDPKGWKIRGIMLQTDLKEDIDYQLIPRGSEGQGVPVEQLNRIYNACDMYISTCTSEGWGLTISEAMACRLPTVVPAHTSCKELAGDGLRAVLLQTLFNYCGIEDNLIRQAVDYYEVADAMILMAKAKYGKLPTPEQMEIGAKVERAYQFIRSLEWKNVTERWIEYFEDIFSCKAK